MTVITINICKVQNSLSEADTFHTFWRPILKPEVAEVKGGWGGHCKEDRRQDRAKDATEGDILRSW